MRRLFAACALFMLIASATFEPVSAHVLIRDQNVNIGAVLHFNPDDDPVAGSEAELFFDIQDAGSKVRIPYSGYQLLITDDSDQTTVVKTVTHDSTVTATYVFPTQGLYRLELKTDDKYDEFQKVSLLYSLRVDRGVSGQAAPVTYSWTTPLITGSIGGLGALAVLFMNNRRQIARQSTW